MTADKTRCLVATRLREVNDKVEGPSTPYIQTGDSHSIGGASVPSPPSVRVIEWVELYGACAHGGDDEEHR